MSVSGAAVTALSSLSQNNDVFQAVTFQSLKRSLSQNVDRC